MSSVGVEVGKGGHEVGALPAHRHRAHDVVVVDELDCGRPRVAAHHPALEIHGEEVAPRQHVLGAAARDLDEPGPQVLLGLLRLDHLEDLPDGHQAKLPASAASSVVEVAVQLLLHRGPGRVVEVHAPHLIGCEPAGQLVVVLRRVDRPQRLHPLALGRHSRPAGRTRSRGNPPPASPSAATDPARKRPSSVCSISRLSGKELFASSSSVVIGKGS